MQDLQQWRREPLSRYLSFNLTPTERDALERLARYEGETLSGTLRRLIRKAAEHEPLTMETRHERAG